MASFSVQPCYLPVRLIEINRSEATYVKHRENNSLEEGARFIKRFFQCLEVVNIQFFVFLDVSSNSV